MELKDLKAFVDNQVLLPMKTKALDLEVGLSTLVGGDPFEGDFAFGEFGRKGARFLELFVGNSCLDGIDISEVEGELATLIKKEKSVPLEERRCALRLYRTVFAVIRFEVDITNRQEAGKKMEPEIFTDSVNDPFFVKADWLAEEFYFNSQEFVLD